MTYDNSRKLIFCDIEKSHKNKLCLQILDKMSHMSQTSFKSSIHTPKQMIHENFK